MDWSNLFPAFVVPEVKDSDGKSIMTKEVEVADIGCGFGGLIVAMSTVFPETLMLGL